MKAVLTVWSTYGGPEPHKYIQKLRLLTCPGLVQVQKSESVRAFSASPGNFNNLKTNKGTILNQINHICGIQNVSPAGTGRSSGNGGKRPSGSGVGSEAARGSLSLINRLKSSWDLLWSIVYHFEVSFDEKWKRILVIRGLGDTCGQTAAGLLAVRWRNFIRLHVRFSAVKERHDCLTIVCNFLRGEERYLWHDRSFQAKRLKTVVWPRRQLDGVQEPITVDKQAQNCFRHPEGHCLLVMSQFWHHAEDAICAAGPVPANSPSERWPDNGMWAGFLSSWRHNSCRMK